METEESDIFIKHHQNFAKYCLNSFEMQDIYTVLAAIDKPLWNLLDRQSFQSWTPCKKFLLACLKTRNLCDTRPTEQPEKPAQNDDSYVAVLIDIECIDLDVHNFQTITFEEFATLPMFRVYPPFLSHDHATQSIFVGELDYRETCAVYTITLISLFPHTTFESLKQILESSQKILQINSLLEPIHWSVSVSPNLKESPVIKDMKISDKDLKIFEQICSGEPISIPIRAEQKEIPWIMPPFLSFSNTPKKRGDSGYSTMARRLEIIPFDPPKEKITKMLEIYQSTWPDIYFVNDPDTKEKLGMAYINSLECSLFVRSHFAPHISTESKECQMLCAYNSALHLWTPIPSNLTSI